VYNLELLKLKFGEANLNFCEVMIKDVADSRRINASLQAASLNNKDKVHITVLLLTSSVAMLSTCLMPPASKAIGL